MEIIALQEYTDKYISLYEGEIRNVNKELADRLIEKGIVAEHSDNGSDSGDINNEIFVVTINTNTLESDKSLGETLSEWQNGGKLIVFKLIGEYLPTQYLIASHFQEDDEHSFIAKDISFVPAEVGKVYLTTTSYKLGENGVKLSMPKYEVTATYVHS